MTTHVMPIEQAVSAVVPASRDSARPAGVFAGLLHEVADPAPAAPARAGHDAPEAGDDHARPEPARRLEHGRALGRASRTGRPAASERVARPDRPGRLVRTGRAADVREADEAPAAGAVLTATAVAGPVPDAGWDRFTTRK